MYGENNGMALAVNNKSGAAKCVRLEKLGKKRDNILDEEPGSTKSKDGMDENSHLKVSVTSDINRKRRREIARKGNAAWWRAVAKR